MRGLTLVMPLLATGIAVAGCRNVRQAQPARVDSAVAVTDSIPDEHPDSVQSAPPDSATMLIALLPAAPGTPLTAAAAGFADRTVFAPRTQRWFLARMIDSTLQLDIGRIDGAVQPADADHEAFQQMVRARSPLQPGMTLLLHEAGGPARATISGIRISGRRVTAVLSATLRDSAAAAYPVEWRGASVAAAPAVSAARCEPGNVNAIELAIARVAALDSAEQSTVRGCFGAFRALIVVRPRVVTTESTERVTLVRADGTTRRGVLKDLSYPLHRVLGLTAIDGDGVDEILVRSTRPAMQTWAALRMTDSVTFTRFASGFTVESR